MSTLLRRFRNWKITNSQLEVGRFTMYLMSPILIMLYIGIDTDKKLGVPGFWPDPARLNRIPKEPAEISRELERMKQVRIAKRENLTARAMALLNDEDKEELKKILENGTVKGSVSEQYYFPPKKDLSQAAFIPVPENETQAAAETPAELAK
ncbi:Protein PET100 [Yarrowia sp. B02]|nr:Protein PET100 [Yarrowia sp. B02]